MSNSKIKIFSYLIIVILTTTSCNKKNDVIPDVVVDFYLDIDDPRFIDLNAIGGSVMVNSSTNNEPYSSGFSGSGIIVTKGVEYGEYFAYDRTCPHDYALDGSVVKVEVDQTSFAKAVCPVCKSTFELISFGTPSSGVSQYPLKNYRATFDGRYIRVWNN